MNPFFYLRGIQNAVNYALRNRVSWSRPIAKPDEVIKSAYRLQNEFREFLELFDWEELSQICEPGGELVLADVGARDFSFAPVLDSHFAALGYQPHVHGIEIDAFRRYGNFRSRADYGRYYASVISKGEYHARDFIDWHADLNICFLLHPFVTPEPPLRWGLPPSAFNPKGLFNHAAHLLRKKRGLLVLSNPTPHEFEISCALAKGAGFEVSELKLWQPDAYTAHRKPRYGAIFRTASV